ncbi:putative phage tail protein [Paenibacillus artemisiicola]|uniref:putative phage tail protein n=1 Tax=Paenibacillus artemisiicola TaxID=1172618 RepID=UPI0030B892F1
MKLLRQLHKLVRQDPFMNELCASIGGEADQIDTSFTDFEAQLNIDTATWGLVIYEKDLGIKTDLSKSLLDRRSVIKSKMRGAGKVDVLLIKLVVSSWTHGSADVSFANGTIAIVFNDLLGVPGSMDDVKAALEQIKPAHLAIVYVFLYNRYEQLQSFTYAQLSSYTYGELKTANL